jgi:hypothetical protein
MDNDSLRVIMFSVDERVLLISLYCVGKLDIVIGMCPVSLAT